FTRCLSLNAPPRAFFLSPCTLNSRRKSWSTWRKRSKRGSAPGRTLPKSWPKRPGRVRGQGSEAGSHRKVNQGQVSRHGTRFVPWFFPTLRETIVHKTRPAKPCVRFLHGKRPTAQKSCRGYQNRGALAWPFEPAGRQTAQSARCGPR